MIKIRKIGLNDIYKCRAGRVAQVVKAFPHLFIFRCRAAAVFVAVHFIGVYR